MDMTLGTHFIIRLLITLVAVLVMIRFCYYRFSQHRSNAASFILFGMGVFLVTYLLHSADVSMGFAFGLFAVFSMLRYRTESIGVKEMTYLFLVIAMALLSAVGTMGHGELVLLCSFICLITFLLETRWVLPLLNEMEIDYEVIDNITPRNRAILLADLSKRCGFEVVSAQVMSIDFLKDTAHLKIHYQASPQKSRASMSTPTGHPHALES